MAQIRMCNRDGKVFGTSQEGWSEWNGKIHSRYEDGTPRESSEHFDFCPECTATMVNTAPAVKVERKMLTSQEKAVDAKAKGYDPDYVAWLERQNGIDHSEPIQGTIDDE
jgi:hypothetical protein